MTTPLPTRVGQLTRLLASDKPGEVTAAAAALQHALNACGLDLNWAADVLASALEPSADKPVDDDLEWLKVDSFTMSYHKKPGSKPGLRVCYRRGASSYFYFWAIEHDGFARAIAIEKWFDLGGQSPAPRTVGEAIHRIDELSDDVEIAVRHDGQFWQVVAQRVRETAHA